MANHSCDPSCVQSFSGATLAIRATRTIKVGEDVSIAYCDSADTRQERRNFLRQNYFFDIDGAEALPGPLPMIRSLTANHVTRNSQPSPGVHLQYYASAPWVTDTRDEELTSVIFLVEGSTGRDIC